MEQELGQKRSLQKIQDEAKRISDQEALNLLEQEKARVEDNEIRYKKRFLDYEKTMNQRVQNLEDYKIQHDG